jgi:hypothetical protein
MRNSVLLWGVFIFTSLAFAQTSWWRTYGGTSYDAGHSVQQTSDSGYVIAGMTRSFGAGASDVYLVKINAQGDTLWTRTYGGTDPDAGYSVQQTPDGGYIVAGETYSFGAGFCDLYLIKTDAQGDTLWTRTYGGTGPDYCNSVKQTSDGGYIIAGETYSFGAGGLDVYLVKTDVLGNTVWTRTYGGVYDDWGFSVQQSSGGGYVIAGGTESFSGMDGDVYLIMTDAQGDTLWTRTYGGVCDDWGYCIQQTSDSGFIVTGYTMSFGAGTPDYPNVYLIRANAQGDTLWTRTYGGPEDDYGYSVQQTPDTGYIIAGQSWSTGAGLYNVYLVKTSAQGDMLWSRTYGGADLEYGHSVQRTSDGGYVIAGLTRSFGAGDYDVYLIKTDANGNIGVQEPSTRHVLNSPAPLLLQPNPFSSFARVPGHEGERFVVSDITGRQVGVCGGNRVGEGLGPGVYFLSPLLDKGYFPGRPTRIVKAASR